MRREFTWALTGVLSLSKSVAIKLSGTLNGSSLKNLKISGFVNTGIECSQIRSSSKKERVILDNIDLIESNQNSTGIIISGSVPDPSFITLNRIVFLSPMKTGIHIDGNLRDVKISNCRFSKLNNGIIIASSRPKLITFHINNNAFFEIKENSVIFNKMPDSQSKENAIYKNIFSNGAASDIVMKQSNWNKKIFEDQFEPFNFLHNFTTRKNVAVSEEIPVFSDGKHYVSEIEFGSTDPGSDQFLKVKSLKANGELIPSTVAQIGVQ